MTSRKIQLRLARKRRIRSRITGTPERPRLSVYCSLMHVSAQVIDDTAKRTLVAASSQEAKTKGKNMEAAKKVGSLIAKKAVAANIKTVVFDRNARKYHGRIKALAEAAREGGLQF